MQSCCDLPDEIIVDILTRLPAKSVGQCRCVSKPWRSLLSRPDFIRTHLCRSRYLRPESLLLVSEVHSRRSKGKKVRHPLYYASLSNAHHLFDEITISAKRLKFASQHNFLTRVHGSCDGLLLVGNWDGEIFVLNPITNEIREVPKSPFALNSVKAEILYGFGYDYVSDDYKIVTISYDYDDYEDDPDNTEMFVNVYLLKTGTWKKSESSPYNHGAAQHTAGVFVDGCIHWLACTTTDREPTIASFDLAREKFGQVPPPSSNAFTMSLSCFCFLIGFSGLVVLGGCLCTFDERGKDVWVMKEYGVKESWTMFTIDDPQVVEIKPVCMFGQGEVVLKDREKLVVYNLAKTMKEEEEEDEEEETLKNVVVHGLQRDLVDEASFVESLVSPHGTNETTRE